MSLKTKYEEVTYLELTNFLTLASNREMVSTLAYKVSESGVVLSSPPQFKSIQWHACDFPHAWEKNWS